MRAKSSKHLCNCTYVLQSIAYSSLATINLVTAVTPSFMLGQLFGQGKSQ